MTEAVLEAGSWIYKMIVTLVIAIICVAIVGLVVKNDTNSIDMQRELLFNRILYDPQGFLYTDKETAVTHTAIIDKELFTQEQANLAFQYVKNYGGASVSLIDGATTTVIINDPTFSAIRVASEARIINGGSIVTRSYPVVIYDKGVRRNGWLSISVAVPSRA